MDTKKALAAIPDKTLNKMLLVGLPVVMLALVALGITHAHRT